MPPKINLVGQAFGNLTVLNEAQDRASDGSVQWRCLCTCGNTTVASANNMKRGITRSCGCLQVQQQKFGSIKHGHSMCSELSPTYITWANMIQRCTNPNHDAYHNYGGRGIRICERWMNFQNFLQDMGERPENLIIDRKNNDGHYEPGNCRWVTYQVSANNTRRTSKDK